MVRLDNGECWSSWERQSGLSNLQGKLNDDYGILALCYGVAKEEEGEEDLCISLELEAGEQ